MTIHHCKWQDLHWDMETPIDALITDPPYSSRTEKGATARRYDDDDPCRVDYGSISAEGAHAFARFFAPLVSSWVVIFADHIAWDWHRRAWEACGWYTFAPVPFIKTNGSPRFTGDGPASMAEWIMVARPVGMPEIMKSRRGWYQGAYLNREGGRRAGHKPAWLLQQVIADYTEPGDLIADPYAGTATIGAAAIGGGRRYVGTEVDAQAHAMARARLDRIEPHLPGLLTGKQPDLIGGGGA